MKSFFRSKYIKSYIITFNNWGSYDLPYEVTLQRNGKQVDFVRCDTYRGACEYYRAFQAMAKNKEATVT